MISMSVKQRVDSLEKKIDKHINQNFFEGRQYVGRYYDELSHEERYQWLKYYESLISPNKEPDIAAFETVHSCITGNLHFICEDRKKPSTKEEVAERVRQIEVYINEKTEEYNA